MGTNPSSYVPAHSSTEGESTENPDFVIHSLLLTVGVGGTSGSTFPLLTATIVGAVALILIIISVILSLVIAVKLCMLL